MPTLLLISVIPVIILCFYIYNKDRDKEPGNLLRKVFLLGMASVIPILLLELFVNYFISTSDNFNLIGLFIATIVGVGLIEELFKWLVVYKTVYNHREFNHSYDAIVYSVFSSLGFALVENIAFVIMNGVGVGIFRAILTVPSHACDAVIMGYYFGLSKQEEYKGNQKKSNRYMLCSLIYPILAHTIYDYFIFADRPLFYVLFIVFIIILYMSCFKIVRKVADNNYNFDGTPATHKSTDEIRILPGEGPQKNVNSLESAFYAVNNTLFFCLAAIIIAIIILLTLY